MNILTFGTFDLFHIGHLRLLERCKHFNNTPQQNKLIVGISTDDFSFSKKKRWPLYDQEQRRSILESLIYVDQVFYEESFELKRDYLLLYKADVFIMGDDWAGAFDEYSDICKVHYLKRTPSISTTELVEIIRNMND